MSKSAPILWGVHSLVNVGVLRLRNILQECESFCFFAGTPTYGIETFTKS